VLGCLWQRGARRVTLNTQEDNRTSQHLYLRFGFNPVGRLITAWQRAI
jgi:RimJ/RimL family protein N-acetyltransferase